MRVRRHDTDMAARALGVSTSEVLLWMHDMQVPDPSQYGPLLDYLVVEERPPPGPRPAESDAPDAVAHPHLTAAAPPPPVRPSSMRG